MKSDEMKVASIAAKKIELRDKMITILISCLVKWYNCPPVLPIKGCVVTSCSDCWREYVEKKAKEEL